jgi:hypothetical protein
MEPFDNDQIGLSAITNDDDSFIMIMIDGWWYDQIDEEFEEQ